jgi:predicted ATPase
VSIVDFPYAVRSRYSTSYARATAAAAPAPGLSWGRGGGENARQEKRQRFSTDEPAARRLADLENTLRLIGLDASEYVPLIAPLVDIPLLEERAAQELRRRQLAALTAWLLTGARSQRVVLAFEDLHWADPTSLDLMQALSERGRPAQLFIIATARPEFRPPWSLRPHHSVISLSPLDRADVAQMVGELAARHALSKEVIEGVSARTGGVAGPKASGFVAIAPPR